MKKSISNRDVDRIAAHAGLTSSDVREVLAMKGTVNNDTVRLVERSCRDLRYAITARDRVAMAAGTSVATVNRAYRADARHLVRQEVLQAIEREATRLGYAPDPVAQARRTQNSPIVAICPELTQLFDPYHTALLRVLAETISSHGLHPMITPIPPQRLLPDIAQSGLTNTVVLWEGRRTEHQVAALEATGRRAVLIGRHPALPSVAPDWISAYADLTQRVLDRGYEVLHLGFLQDHGWASSARLEGAARALRAHSGPLPELHLWLDSSADVKLAVETLLEHGHDTAAKLLSDLIQMPGALSWCEGLEKDDVAEELLNELKVLRGTTGRRVAMLGHSDITACRLLRRLNHDHPEWRLGLEVGLGGHDNLEPLLGYLDPLITTVEYDVQLLATTIMNMVIDATPQAEHSAAFAPIPVRIVARQSL